MPRITPIEIQDADPKVKPLFEALNKGLGMVPNLYRTVAQSPAVLEGALAFGGALAKGSLGGALGEQIALLTAEQNGCAYCASAHTALGKRFGLKDGDVDEAREGRASTARAQAALTLARAVLETRGHVGDATLRAAREAGLTDAQITEVVGHVAINVFTNYFNSLAATEIDFPAVRAPKLVAR